MAIPNDRTGTELCPWRIAELPGQRILLDLLDFSLSIAVSEIYDHQDPSTPCPVFITVVDQRGHVDIVYLCNVNIRQRTVYTSRDNIIDFYTNINATLTRSPIYMFSYKGKHHFGFLKVDSSSVQVSARARCAIFDQ